MNCASTFRRAATSSGGKRQPLVERHVGIIVALEDFQETQLGVTGTLNMFLREMAFFLLLITCSQLFAWRLNPNLLP
jgi:hypothetical protein